MVTLLTLAVTLAGTASSQSSKSLAVLFDNGPFITHKSGGHLNAARSEMKASLKVSTSKSSSQFSLGLNCHSDGGFQLADDFNVPKHTVFNIERIRLVYYELGNATPKLKSAHVRIWSSSPNAGGQILLDEVAKGNNLQIRFANAYRMFEGGGSTSVNRPIHFLDIELSKVCSLSSGVYWLEWSVDSESTSPARSNSRFPRSTLSLEKTSIRPSEALKNPQSRAQKVNHGAYSVIVTKNGIPTFSGSNSLQRNESDKDWRQSKNHEATYSYDLCFQLLGTRSNVADRTISLL
jgi:hypothetical protein